jgi:hypothetical protein
MEEECGMKDKLLSIHHCGIPPSASLLSCPSCLNPPLAILSFWVLLGIPRYAESFITRLVAGALYASGVRRSSAARAVAFFTLFTFFKWAHGFARDGG